MVNGNVPQSGSTDISYRILVSALHCLILSLVKTNPELSADSKDKIALQVLSDAHHPAVCKFTFPSLLAEVSHGEKSVSVNERRDYLCASREILKLIPWEKHDV